MNEREFLTAVINGTITADVIAHATEGIAKLDARNEKRKATQTKTQKENEPIALAILDALTATPNGMLGVDLATAIGQTTNKTNGVAGNLVKAEVLVKSKVKVKGKGEMTYYELAPTAEGEGEVAED
jgi:hypothetical protein